MYRRICLVGALLALCSLAFGVAFAGAKGSHKTKKPTVPTTVTVKSTCKFTMTGVPAAGDTGVLPDAQSGNMYGPIKCSSGGGTGVVSFPFTVADTGDLVGKMTGFFAAGSATGKVDLSESSSSLPTPYQFGNASLSGTFKFVSGTGNDKGITGKSTSFTCATPDSVHYSCTLKLKITVTTALQG